jgi:hypothetical protein
MTDHALQLGRHLEPDPRRVAGLRSLLLHHVELVVLTSSHFIAWLWVRIGAALSSDERQIACVLQAWLIPQRVQATLLP